MSVYTTVRVTTNARDRVNALAQAQGVSAAAMIERLVDSAWWQSAFRSERDAQRQDSANADVATEEAEWEATSADGIE